MKYIVIVVGILFLQWKSKYRRTCAMNNQPIVSWDSLIHWRIYSENDFRRVFQVTVDSLGFLPYKALNDDSMHRFLRDVKPLNRGVNPLWMGCYLVSCENEQGGEMKFVVSQYGGFFYRQSDSTYFEVSRDLSKEWLTYFTQSYMRFVR